MHVRVRGLVLLAVVLTTPSVDAQQKPRNPPASRGKPSEPPAMTNADVIKLVKAGLSDALIVGTIKRADRRAFAVSADALLELKAAGLSEDIIRVMLDPDAPVPAAPAPASTPRPDSPVVPSKPEAVPPVQEIGVYYRDDERWVEIPPEVVNWKTGGVLKHWASAGVVKGDVNGLLNGPSSRTLLKSGTRILIYAPDGTAATEYQLLRLHQQGNRREFRTVTGGVLHQQGGALRDLVPLETEKIMPRTYVAQLPNLGPGEFGILPPGAFTSTSASAQLGKMYSFRIE